MDGAAGDTAKDGACLKQKSLWWAVQGRTHRVRRAVRATALDFPAQQDSVAGKQTYDSLKEESSGGPCRIRTCDLLIKSQQLYQLS